MASDTLYREANPWMGPTVNDHKAETMLELLTEWGWLVPVEIDYEAAMAYGITLQEAVDIIHPALGLGPDDGNPPWEDHERFGPDVSTIGGDE
jgi:hypothetical protein